VETKVTLTAAAPIQEVAAPAVMAALALADVPDPRSRHGRIHPLPAVLGLVVLGLLMGKKSLSAIARLGRHDGPPLAHALGFRRGKTPAKSMLSQLLRTLDAPAVEAALSRWVASRLPEGLSQLSRDGKTLRGSRDGNLPGSPPPLAPADARRRCVTPPAPGLSRTFSGV
jgi:hypothetical protein